MRMSRVVLLRMLHEVVLKKLLNMLMKMFLVVLRYFLALFGDLWVELRNVPKSVALFVRLRSVSPTPMVVPSSTASGDHGLKFPIFRPKYWRNIRYRRQPKRNQSWKIV